MTFSTPSGKAPDGSSNATTIIPNSGSGASVAQQSLGSGAGAYTISAYMRKNGAQYGALTIFTGSSYSVAVFDLQNGILGAVASGMTSSIAYASNGWYRCTASVASTNLFVGITPRSSNSTAISQTYAGTETVDVAFVQLEIGSAASSYAPTTTGTASRSADSLALPWTATTFTGRAKAALAALVTGDYLADTGNGLLTEAAGPGVQSSNGTQALSTGITAFTQTNVIVVGGSPSGRVLSANGNAAVSDANPLVPSAPSHFDLGGSSGGANQAAGNYAQVGVWNVAATAAQAATLSGIA